VKLAHRRELMQQIKAQPKESTAAAKEADAGRAVHPVREAQS